MIIVHYAYHYLIFPLYCCIQTLRQSAGGLSPAAGSGVTLGAEEATDVSHDLMSAITTGGIDQTPGEPVDDQEGEEGGSVDLDKPEGEVDEALDGVSAAPGGGVTGGVGVTSHHQRGLQRGNHRRKSGGRFVGGGGIGGLLQMLWIVHDLAKVLSKNGVLPGGRSGGSIKKPPPSRTPTGEPPDGGEDDLGDEEELSDRQGGGGKYKGAPRPKGRFFNPDDLGTLAKVIEQMAEILRLIKGLGKGGGEGRLGPAGMGLGNVGGTRVRFGC